MIKNKKNIYIAAIGFIISIVSYFISDSIEQQRLKIIFDRDASDRINIITGSLEKTRFATESLRNYFLLKDNVNYEEFRSFAEYYSSNISGIQAIEWVPRVPIENKEEFIKQARLSLNSDFNIVEVNNEGNLIPVKDRSDYYPVYYIEPFEGNEKALGFDLASNKSRYKSLKKSIETNKFSVTERIALVQEKENEFAVLLFEPVIKKNSVKSIQNEDNILGFTLGVFRPKDIIESSIDFLQPSGINIYLKDESATENKRLLYIHKSRGDSILTTANTDISFHKQFLFGGRVWSITCEPTEYFLTNHYSFIPVITFFIFFTLTGFFIYYYHTNFNEKEKINKLVNLRTNELEESKERLNLALNSADLGMWDWNIETNEIFINERWSSMLGYLNGDINPSLESWDKLIHPDDRDEVYEILNKHLDDKIPIYSTEHRLLTKSGKWKWILDVGQVVERDSEGKALRATGIHMDISERKTIQQKIMTYNNKLKKTNQDKNKLFSIIGHDLKSPLTAIKGFSEFLTNELEDLDEKEIREYSKYIYDSSNSLFQMLEGLLEWGRVQMDSIQYDPRLYNLSKQIERVLSQYAVISLNKKILLNTDFDDNIEVFADESMVETILRNLLSNGLKFTPNNGKITIAVSQYDSSSILVSVSDTGVGIEKNAFATLFQSSFHSSTNGTEGEKGTGLGLSLCKEFVEMNNGQIWAESKINHGTTFFFTICTAKDNLRKEKKDFTYQEYLN